MAGGGAEKSLAIAECCGEDGSGMGPEGRGLNTMWPKPGFSSVELLGGLLAKRSLKDPKKTRQTLLCK